MVEDIKKVYPVDYKKVYDYILDGVKQWREEVYHDLEEIEADLFDEKGKSRQLQKLYVKATTKAELLDELLLMVEEALEEA